MTDDIFDLMDKSEDALFQEIINRQEGALGVAESSVSGPCPTDAELERWELALDKLDGAQTEPQATGNTASHKPRNFRLIIAVAVLAAFLAVTAGAVIFHVFHFNMLGELGSLTPSGIVVLPAPNAQGYQTLNDMLLDHDLPAIEPTWIPVRYSLSDLALANESADSRQVSLCAWYSDSESSGKQTLSILITRYSQEVPLSLIANYEKNEGYERLELNNGIICYVYANLEMAGAVWEVEGHNCTYSITGPVSRAEMKHIVESIKT